MLRAAGLLRLLSGIQRFSTSGHPEALVACYVAAWPLPRLDSHQLAVDSFRTHHALVRRQVDYRGASERESGPPELNPTGSQLLQT